MKAFAAFTLFAEAFATKIQYPRPTLLAESSECTQEEIIAAVLPSDIEVADLGIYTFECARFSDHFINGGTHRPRLVNLKGLGTDYQYVGFEWTVSNGVETRRTQLQSLDIFSGAALDLGHGLEMTDWDFEDIDLARHYFANHSYFDIVGVDSMQNGELPVAYMGNVFDGTHLVVHT